MVGERTKLYQVEEEEKDGTRVKVSFTVSLVGKCQPRGIRKTAPSHALGWVGCRLALYSASAGAGARARRSNGRNLSNSWGSSFLGKHLLAIGLHVMLNGHWLQARQSTEVRTLLYLVGGTEGGTNKLMEAGRCYLGLLGLLGTLEA